MTVARRFWSKVNKHGPVPPHRPELGRCWPWKACRTERGYGRFNRRHHAERTDKAHRFSYILTFGSVPEGMWVLHRCDNPACVRPDHLFLGDHAANMADMVAKKRHTHPRAKLTPDEVITVRALLAEPQCSQRVIAERYGVDRATISHIKTGFTYRWVETAVSP